MADKINVAEKSFPGLYQSADSTSLESQRKYFFGLFLYLFLLIAAAFTSFLWPETVESALVSAMLFLITLGILVFLRVKRPDDVWYNGRAVAESVKTISWRWMMRADPYLDCKNINDAKKQFIEDLKNILEQNRGLSHSLMSSVALSDPISNVMLRVRELPIGERLALYKEQRIDDQANWYADKSAYNKKRAGEWFWVSVLLHFIAICILLYKIKVPTLDLPIEVIATAAGAVLTWLQAKKHNELNSSYSLATHEIGIIKGEADFVENELEFSDFVINSESAFSREHTQWVARKVD